MKKLLFIFLLCSQVNAQYVERIDTLSALPSIATHGKKYIAGGKLWRFSGNGGWYVIQDDVGQIMHRDSVLNPANVPTNPNALLKSDSGSLFITATTIASKVSTTDPRLTDARTPLAHTHLKANVTDFAHTHPESEVTNLVSDLAGKQASLGFTPENSANKNASSGYAGLTSSKLAFSQGQNVWMQAASLSGDVTTTNTSATAIAGLSFSIAANEVWVFDAYLNIGTSSNAGTKYAVDIPTSATMLVMCYGTTTAGTAFTTDELSTDATLGAQAWNTTAAITTAANPDAFIHLHGTVRNGANAGTVQLMQAKVTSGTSSVYANSYLQAFKVQ